MSSPSSPIDLFESLTLDPQMSPTSTEIRSRAVEVRDILSSFDRDIFPSEFKPHIFEQLDRPFQARPPVSQWTIQEDLLATLLQWGAYNDQAYELLSSLQSGPTLARCFYEKLERRFRLLFEEYDRLSDEDQTVVRSEIPRIAQGFRDVVAAVREDRLFRESGHEAIAKRLLDAVIGVCRRHATLVTDSRTATTPRRGTRRSLSSPTSECPPNLYEALIKSPDAGQISDPFMLDVLETFPGTVFANLESEYLNLVSLLDVNSAPAAYKYRVGRLLSGTGAPGPISGIGDAQSQRQSEAPQATTLSSKEPSAAKPSSPALQDQPEGRAQAQAQAQTRTRSSAQIEPSSSTTTRSKRLAEDPGTGATIKKGKKKTKE